MRRERDDKDNALPLCSAVNIETAISLKFENQSSKIDEKHNKDSHEAISSRRLGCRWQQQQRRHAPISTRATQRCDRAPAAIRSATDVDRRADTNATRRVVVSIGRTIALRGTRIRCETRPKTTPTTTMLTTMTTTTRLYVERRARVQTYAPRAVQLVSWGATALATTTTKAVMSVEPSEHVNRRAPLLRQVLQKIYMIHWKFIYLQIITETRLT